MPCLHSLRSWAIYFTFARLHLAGKMIISPRLRLGRIVFIGALITTITIPWKKLGLTLQNAYKGLLKTVPLLRYHPVHYTSGNFALCGLIFKRWTVILRRSLKNYLEGFPIKKFILVKICIVLVILRWEAAVWI